jgi:hypothetical protein
MTKTSLSSLSELAKQQGATALLAAMFTFLLRNNVSKKLIVEAMRQHHGHKRISGNARQYRRLVRAYEDMGMVMSAWFSLPKFLDAEGHPLPLTAVRGSQSVPSLVRASRVKTSATLAVELFRRSPSVRIDARGNFVALKRIFVLPDFEIPRAALVIGRYLDTLGRNSSAQRNDTILLLERNCHVPEIDLRKINPILRDIKGRGTAFMDSVDGDIEAHRIRRSRRKGVGELGVLVFAWTRTPTTRRSKSSLKVNFERKETGV